MGTEGARVLALRCEPKVNELARRMTRKSFEQLPGYAGLPDDVKDLEIAATIRHGVRLFLRRATEPHPGPGGLASSANGRCSVPRKGCAAASVAAQSRARHVRPVAVAA
ncbi:hypothetical protein ACFVRD_00100 [Streptomyces sp. NPDC057908]|uniref:hypothetical protein n=1 Tax=Streptomyces sp. NPDC057908 TaxID=3346276 RepID=UPI0036ECDF3E